MFCAAFLKPVSMTRQISLTAYPHPYPPRRHRRISSTILRQDASSILFDGSAAALKTLPMPAMSGKARGADREWKLKIGP